MKAGQKEALLALLVLLLQLPVQARDNLQSLIKEKIQQFYMQRLSVSAEDLRLTFPRLPKLTALKDQALTIECRSQSNVLRLGRQSIWVLFIKKQKIILKSPVTVDVAVRKKVFLTRQSIGYRRRIEPDQVRQEKVWIRDIEVYERAITSEEQLALKESTHFIPRGKILLNSDLQEPTVIKPGDEVEIYVRAGGLVLKTRGIARSAGSVGDMVSVKNTMTGKNLKGKITSPGVVFINQSRSL